MKRILVFFFTFWAFVSIKAAVVDTIQIYSQSMQKNIKAVIITPDNYASAKELPVVYLLHGYSGTHLDWISKARGFEKAADQYNLIIVCPDGGYGSWYWNSPVDPNSLAIIIDCGTDDFFFKVNENLHQQLMYRNIPHDYVSRPGAHTWPYWTNAVKYQLLFMKNYFDNAKH